MKRFAIKLDGGWFCGAIIVGSMNVIEDRPAPNWTFDSREEAEEKAKTFRLSNYEVCEI